MDIAIPKWLVPWLVGGGLTGIALALIIVVRAYVQMRRAEYYVVREEARRAVVRTSLVIPLLAVLIVAVLLLPRQAPAPAPTPTPDQTPTAQPSNPTPTPSVSATPTPTPLPTATEPFIPTSTPRATLPVTFTSPLPSLVPPPADARFEFWTLAQGVDENDQPINPSKQFPAGIERVYLFFRYDGLLPNVPWTTVWYRNGAYLAGGTDLWQSQRPVGERFVFLGQTGGYTVGEYEVQVWLGERLQIRAFFSIVEAEG